MTSGHPRSLQGNEKMPQTSEGPHFQPDDILKLATDMVMAYVRNNRIPASEVPAMLKTIHGTLGALIGAAESELATGQKPAVPIKRSVHPDYIVCLEDGKKLKMLKRHLKTAYNMTPEEYRDRWSLPPDYPMVAPNYARQRSRLAKEIGLGTRGRRGAG